MPEETFHGALTCQVGMWIHNRIRPLGISIPGTMNIIRHNVEEVHIGAHTWEVKAL
jgi:hypothetical protein